MGCTLSQEGDAFAAMYENGGILATHDGGINVLAGSTVGGERDACTNTNVVLAHEAF